MPVIRSYSFGDSGARRRKVSSVRLAGSSISRFCSLTLSGGSRSFRISLSPHGGSGRETVRRGSSEAQEVFWRLSRSATRAPGAQCADAGQDVPSFPCAPFLVSLDEAEHLLHNRGCQRRYARWCSGSSRNAVRLPSRTSVRLRRNPPARVRVYFTDQHKNQEAIARALLVVIDRVDRMHAKAEEAMNKTTEVRESLVCKCATAPRGLKPPLTQEGHLKGGLQPKLAAPQRGLRDRSPYSRLTMDLCVCVQHF
jgi:hypothetical protein